MKAECNKTIAQSAFFAGAFGRPERVTIMQMSRRARTCSRLRHRKCGAPRTLTQHTGAFPLSRASQPSFVAAAAHIGTRRARTADLKTHK